jgi:hypothetical protein
VPWAAEVWAELAADLGEGLGVVLAVESAGLAEASEALGAELAGLAEAWVELAEAWEAWVVVLAGVLVVLVELAAAGLAALVALGLAAPWALVDEHFDCLKRPGRLDPTSRPGFVLDSL